MISGRYVFIGRVWSFGFHLEGENREKSKPSLSCHWPLRCQTTKKSFSGISTAIGLIFGVEDHVMRKEEEKTEEFNAFFFSFASVFNSTDRSWAAWPQNWGTMTGGAKTFHLYILKDCVSSACHRSRWGSPWSTEGISSCYSWTPFNNLLEVTKACGGPC